VVYGATKAGRHHRSHGCPASIFLPQCCWSILPESRWRWSETHHSRALTGYLRNSPSICVGRRTGPVVHNGCRCLNPAAVFCCSTRGAHVGLGRLRLLKHKLRIKRESKLRFSSNLRAIASRAICLTVEQLSGNHVRLFLRRRRCSAKQDVLAHSINRAMPTSYLSSPMRLTNPPSNATTAHSRLPHGAASAEWRYER